MATIPNTALRLETRIEDNGTLKLSLGEIPVTDPAADEVVVQIQASPINPSDLAMLFGTADVSTAKQSGSADRPVVTVDIPPQGRAAMANRVGKAYGIGNEGAGVVVAAGESDAAQSLLGRTVACRGGELHAQFRTLKTEQCFLLPDDVSPIEGAACFTNPMTALCMIETMRLEGHTALVHTAAASNLGLMLNKVCLADGIGLVNVARKQEHEVLLRGLGAQHVVNSGAPTFHEDLVAAIGDVGATLGFDAVGGGRLAGDILGAMEIAMARKMPDYSRYGSPQHKQVYIYGRLDLGEVVLPFNLGMAWSVGGWLSTYALEKIGPDGVSAVRKRVFSELKTTFASRYTAEISLKEALNVETLKAYGRKATGEKYLLKPNTSD